MLRDCHLLQSPLGTLKLSGYLRGQTLSVNSLVHIPGWGDYQMCQIDAPGDPHLLGSTRPEIQEHKVLAVAEPAKQVRRCLKHVVFKDGFILRKTDLYCLF